MPVYERGYTHWTGSGLRADPSWWVIARRGLARPLRNRGFFLLIFVAWVPAIVKGAIIYTKAKAGQLMDLAFGGAWAGIDPAGFLAFVDGQRFFAFLFTTLVGARLIAMDRRENGLSLYFSRPLTLFDYVAGKTLIVLGWYLAVTVVPALVLCLFTYLIDPAATGVELLILTPLRLVIHGLATGTALSLVLLAFSALGSRTIFIVVWWTVLWMGTESVGGIFAAIGVPWLQIVNFGGQFSNAATLIFAAAPRYEVSPWMSLALCAGWVALALAILRHRIRPVEVVT
jgi:ABC-type transport system involved in multi-copper enzyme maturation permease subunit